MKQQVNLLPLVIQKEGILTSRLLISLWAVLIVILGLVSGYEQYQLMVLKQTLADLGNKDSKMKQELDNIAASLPGKDETEFLISEIDRRETEVQTKQHVISQLSGSAIGNTVGFSGYLEGFARQIRNGIWIRKISITDGGADLNIYGTTLSPGLVPKLLKNLSNEQVFSDTEFKSFIMKRPEDQPEDKKNSKNIDFTIQTSLPKEGGTNLDPIIGKEKRSIDRAQAILKSLSDAGAAQQSKENEDVK